MSTFRRPCTTSSESPQPDPFKPAGSGRFVGIADTSTWSQWSKDLAEMFVSDTSFGFPATMRNVDDGFVNVMNDFHGPVANSYMFSQTEPNNSICYMKHAPQIKFSVVNIHGPYLDSDVYVSDLTLDILDELRMNVAGLMVMIDGQHLFTISRHRDMNFWMIPQDFIMNMIACIKFSVVRFAETETLCVVTELNEYVPDGPKRDPEVAKSYKHLDGMCSLSRVRRAPDVYHFYEKDDAITKETIKIEQAGAILKDKVARFEVNMKNLERTSLGSQLAMYLRKKYYSPFDRRGESLNLTRRGFIDRVRERMTNKWRPGAHPAAGSVKDVQDVIEARTHVSIPPLEEIRHIGEYHSIYEPQAPDMKTTQKALAGEDEEQGEVIQEAQVSFVEQHVDHEVDTSDIKPVFLEIAAHPSESTRFSQILERQFPIAHANWNATQEQNTAILELSLPHVIAEKLTEIPASDIFKYFEYFKCDLEIEIKLNSVKSQLGTLQCSWYYCSMQDDDFESLRSNVWNASNRTFVDIVASSSSSAKMTIKYKYFMEYLAIHEQAAGQQMHLGTLSVLVKNPLVVVEGAASSCYVSVYVRMINTDFCGQRIKSTVGVQRMVRLDDGSSYERLSDDLLVEPQMLSVFKRGLSKVVDRGIDYILPDPNRDEPMVQRTNLPVEPMSMPDICKGRDQVETVSSLTIGDYPGVAHPDLVEDEMSLRKIVSRPTLIGTNVWNKNDGINKVIYKAAADPWIKSPSVTQDGEAVSQLSNVGMIASCFSYWRGTLNFDVEIVATAFHSGRLAACYCPGAEIAPTMVNISNLNHAIIDVKGHTKIRFSVPFIYPMPFVRRSNKPNLSDESGYKVPGYFYIMVMNPMTISDMVPNIIYLNVSLSAGDDFEFGVPSAPSFGLGYQPLDSKPKPNSITPIEGYTPGYVTWNDARTKVKGITYATLYHATTSGAIVRFQGLKQDKIYSVPHKVVIDYKEYDFRIPYKDARGAIRSVQYVTAFQGNETDPNNQYKIVVCFANRTYAHAYVSRKDIAGAIVYVSATSYWQIADEGVWKDAPTDFRPTFDEVSAFDVFPQDEIEPQMESEVSKVENESNVDKMSMISFSEDIQSIKDYGRRYARYCSLSIPGVNGNPLPGIYNVRVPIYPSGVRLDLSNSKNPDMLLRDNHISYILSAYRFCRGSLNFKFIFHKADPRDEVTIEFRPDEYNSERACNTHVSQDRFYLNDMGYPTAKQKMGVNTVVNFRVPYHVPAKFQLLQEPKIDHKTFAINAVGMGSIYLYYRGHSMDQSVSLDVLYSLGDDFQAYEFIGFPPIIEKAHYTDVVAQMHALKKASGSIGDISEASKSVANDIAELKDEIVESTIHFNRMSDSLSTAAIGFERLLHEMVPLAENVNKMLSTSNIILSTSHMRYILYGIIMIAKTKGQEIVMPMTLILDSTMCVFIDIKNNDAFSKLAVVANNIVNTREAEPQSIRSKVDQVSRIIDAHQKDFEKAVRAIIGAVCVSIGLKKFKLEPKFFKDAMIMVAGATTLSELVVQCLVIVKGVLLFCLQRKEERSLLAGKMMIGDPELVQWMASIDYMTGNAVRDEILGSQAMITEVYKLTAQAESYSHMLAVTPKTFPNLAVILEYIRRIRQLSDKLSAERRFPNLAFEPYVVCLLGESGCGKSFIADELISEICRRNGVTPGNGGLIYTKTPGTQYWNGLASQPVVKFDDFGQCNDGNNTEFGDLISLKTSASFNPPMAEIENKKIHYSPVLAVLCTNTAFPRPNSIADYTALWRRRDIMVQVRAKYPNIKEWRKNHRDEARNHEELQFRIARDAANEHTAYGPYMNFEEIKETLCEMFREYYRDELQNYRGRLDREMSQYTHDNFVNYTRQHDRVLEHIEKNGGVDVDFVADVRNLDYMNRRTRFEKDAEVMDMIEPQMPNPSQKSTGAISKLTSRVTSTAASTSENRERSWRSEERLCPQVEPVRRGDSRPAIHRRDWVTQGASARLEPLQQPKESKDKCFRDSVKQKYEEWSEDKVFAGSTQKCQTVVDKNWNAYTQAMARIRQCNKYPSGRSKGLYSDPILLEMVKVEVKDPLRCPFFSKDMMVLPKSFEVGFSQWYDDFILLNYFDSDKRPNLCKHAFLTGNHKYSPEDKCYIALGSPKIPDYDCEGEDWHSCLFRDYNFKKIFYYTWMKMNRALVEIAIMDPHYMTVLPPVVAEVVANHANTYLKNDFNTSEWTLDKEFLKHGVFRLKKLTETPQDRNVEIGKNVLKAVSALTVASGVAFAGFKAYKAIQSGQSLSMGIPKVCKFFGKKEDSEDNDKSEDDNDVIPEASPILGSVNRQPRRAMRQAKYQGRFDRVRPEFQDYNDSELLETFAAKIRRNTFFIVCDDVPHRCLIYSGRDFILCSHYTDRFGNSVKIEGPMYNLEVLTSDLNIRHIDGTGLARATLPNQFPMGLKLESMIYEGSMPEVDFVVQIEVQENAEIEIFKHYANYIDSITVGGKGEFGSWTMSNAITYDRSMRGSCGSVVIHKVQNEYKILGIHTAGSVMHNAGFAELINKEMLNLKKCTIGYVALPESRESKHFSLEGDYIDLGTVTKGATLSEKSRIKPSLIHDAFESSSYPAPLTSKQSLFNGSPLLSGCDKNVDVVGRFNEDELDLAIINFKIKIMERVKPLSEVKTRSAQEAIDGYDGCNPIEMSTSPGYPWVKSRPVGEVGKAYLFDRTLEQNGYTTVGIDDRLCKALKDGLACRRRGEIPITIYSDCLKDARIPKEKLDKPGCTRTFGASPIDATIVHRQLFQDFINAYTAQMFNMEHTIGINAESPEWGQLYLRVTSKGSEYMTGDYSAFGPKLSAQVAKRIVKDIINPWYTKHGSGSDNTARLVAAEELFSCIHLCKNNLYQTFGGSPSGCIFCVQINSMVNSVYFRLGVVHILGRKYLESFDRFFGLYTNGDDLLCALADGISSKFNNEKYAEFLQNYGIKYTMPDKSGKMVPFVGINKVEYLKRGFRKHKSGNDLYTLAPMNIKTIQDCCLWIRDNEMTAERNTIINADQSIRLAHGRGKEFFDNHQIYIDKKLKQKGLCRMPLDWDDLDIRRITEGDIGLMEDLE